MTKFAKFAKFALPAALAFAAFGAQASEFYPAVTAADAPAPTTTAAAPAVAVNPADVYFPSAINRFERSPAAGSSMIEATMKRDGATVDLSYVGA